MTDTRNGLVQEALQIGSHHKRRETEANEKQAALRLEMQQQEHIADAARLAFERSLNFGKTLGADLLCPQCWVAQGEKANLVAIPSDNDWDNFKCHSCGLEYSFPP